MSEILTIKCRVFNKLDFPVYKEWFSDPELNKQLGPMNEDWLKHILTDNQGEQFSFFQSDKLVAVAGVNYPDTDHNYYFLTDIAIRPDLRRTGLGTKVLRHLQFLPELQEVSIWRATVVSCNASAIRLLTRVGWKYCDKYFNKNEFIEFESCTTKLSLHVKVKS